MATAAVLNPSLSRSDIRLPSDFNLEATKRIQELAKQRMPSSSEGEGVSFQARQLSPDKSDPALKLALQKIHSSGFISRILALVNNILEQLSKASENKSAQIEKLKDDFRATSKESANLLRAMGTAGLWISAAAFGVLMLQFVPIPGLEQEDKKILEFLSQQVPQVGGLFTSDYQARQRQAEALTQLLNTEYSAKANQQEPNKQEFNQLVQQVLDAFKRASSGQ